MSRTGDDRFEPPADGIQNRDLVSFLAAVQKNWREERPDLDPWPFEFQGYILGMQRALENALAPILAELDLRGGDYEILSHLRRRGEPYTASPTELSQVLDITTGAMTRRLDRLEELGFVRRRPHDEDRRSLYVDLTELGHSVSDRAVERILGALSEIFTPVRPKLTQLRTMTVAVMAQMKDHNE